MIPWLAVQQLLDSALPIGGFSHSFGLETAVQEGRIRNMLELEKYLGTMILQSWSTADAMVVKAVYETADGQDWKRLWHVERLVHLQRIGSETRSGVEKMGRRLLQLAVVIHPAIDWSPLQKAHESGECLATHPLVHGFICLRLGLSLEQAVQGYLYTCIVTGTGSALRLLSVGQTECQALITRLSPVIGQGWEIARELRPEDAYGNVPVSELYAARHETLYSRLFMS
ncbi:urease accessory protein UreF [Paenibacillus sp. URB8-2]|uniref:urease accessory protein UreF n=1 Tax=Paenibacillus sp. URB8-2 TaxID=2741301 RepID=UPI0015C1F1F5|nr:urease accessory UreF family protein [Paenibacillus sp. URB8-2]BCG57072.1 urease accessory protein UreF [Paenibacillus sp. URB8-2]